MLTSMRKNEQIIPATQPQVRTVLKYLEIASSVREAINEGTVLLMVKSAINVTGEITLLDAVDKKLTT